MAPSKKKQKIAVTEANASDGEEDDLDSDEYDLDREDDEDILGDDEDFSDATDNEF